MRADGGMWACEEMPEAATWAEQGNVRVAKGSITSVPEPNGPGPGGEGGENLYACVMTRGGVQTRPAGWGVDTEWHGDSHTYTLGADATQSQTSEASDSLVRTYCCCDMTLATPS